MTALMKGKRAPRGQRRGTRKMKPKPIVMIPESMPIKPTPQELRQARRKMLAKRRERQRTPPRYPDTADRSANSHGAYRKSIWPARKIAKPGRMA